MRRDLLMVLSLTLAMAGPLDAGTFEKTPLAPELGLDALDRRVTRERLGRDLFADAWATVTIAHVDVYDRFPYVESRQFQVVSDPRWNRLVFGERGRSLRAFDGRGTTLGALSQPRGMAVDENDHVYVADAGNDRIVVFQAVSEFDALTLVPLYAIDGLSGPYDVAFSDGGTPFAPADDHLYVTDTGRNRVAAFALAGGRPREVASIGELGSGPGRFAGPLAIATGPAEGGAGADVYVADAHNRRIVHLRHQGGSLAWAGEARHDSDVLTSLETDPWGNLYAAAPREGVVRKFAPDLAPVAVLRGGLSHPRSFHVPFANVRDHRDGSVARVGQAQAISVDQWSDVSGLGLWNLGVEVSELGVTGGESPAAHFTLTDRANVALEVVNPANGAVIARRGVGTLAAGLHTVAIVPEDLRGVSGVSDLMLRVSASSTYPDGPSDVAQAAFQASGSGVAALPSRPVLLGNTPNPIVASTRIAFVLPASADEGATLRLFDALGRRVRSFEQDFAPGLNEVPWDGTDDHGRRVRAGVYFYRLEFGGERFTRRMVLVH